MIPIRFKLDHCEASKYLISNALSDFSLNKLKNVFGIKDIHTMKNWLSFLEDGYLIFVLERFSFKLKEQAIAAKKIYCIDTGLANVVLGLARIKGK